MKWTSGIKLKMHTDGVNFVSKIERRERNNIPDEIFAIISE